MTTQRRHSAAILGSLGSIALGSIALVAALFAPLVHAQTVLARDAASFVCE